MRVVVQIFDLGMLFLGLILLILLSPQLGFSIDEIQLRFVFVVDCFFQEEADQFVVIPFDGDGDAIIAVHLQLAEIYSTLPEEEFYDFGVALLAR